MFSKCDKTVKDESSKLILCYNGPFVINDVFPSDTYSVQNRHRNYSITYHVYQLKPLNLFETVDNDEEKRNKENEYEDKKN